MPLFSRSRIPPPHSCEGRNPQTHSAILDSHFRGNEHPGEAGNAHSSPHSCEGRKPLNNKHLLRILSVRYPAKQVLSTAWLLVLLAIFDKPVLDFLFVGDLSFLLTFAQHNYSGKENLILIFWALSLAVFPLLFFVQKEGRLQCRHNVLFRDVAIVSVTVYYLFIRHDTFSIGLNHYALPGFGQSGTIRYPDILFLLPALSLFNFVCCIREGQKSKKIEHRSLWEYDKPIEPILNNPDYPYKSLVSLLSDQISKVADPFSSFSIGIVGPWGSGKTSFLNTLRAVLQKKKSNLLIDFNPWLYPDEKNLTRAFLKELSLKISPFTVMGSNAFNELISKLSKDKSNLWSLMVNGASRNHSLEEIYMSIRESIHRSKKRVVVIIDDIDRLRFNEIYELLSIIRNIGNLPNTVFIVAYDKDYLLEVLADNIRNPQKYLEKFFHAEYPLGKISADSIVHELAAQLIAAFPALFSPHHSLIASNKIPAMLNPYTTIGSLTGIKLIKNRRDIKVLINNIRILWPLFRGERVELNQYFTDFLKLEILRLTYGSVYTKIKYLDGSLFEKREGIIVYTGSENREIEKLVASNNDQSEVNGILKSLFPGNRPAPEIYSVSNADFFDYYFMSEVIHKFPRKDYPQNDPSELRPRDDKNDYPRIFTY